MDISLETLFLYAPQAIAVVCLGWCIAVVIIQTIGIVQIFRNFSSRPKPPVSPALPLSDVPHVTLIRPVSGLEPDLHACLASTFRQSYPKSRFSIRLCVESESDPAYPLLRKLVDTEFPELDAQVLVQTQDEHAHGANGDANGLGPNRKVRNISRAYREAKSDIIWMLDSNVWVGRNTAGRMVDRLMGFSQDGEAKLPYKLVHQLPIVVDTVEHTGQPSSEAQALLSPEHETASAGPWTLSSIWKQGGGRLDEMFMATTHSKFYMSFNTVQAAPCVMGKSNMFRKSDLLLATDREHNPVVSKDVVVRPKGIDYFSSYICEDHMIGLRLWELLKPGSDGHGIMHGDLAVQPTKDMSVEGYWSRRVRWLRARKWTVLLATWVEPGIECLLWSLYFSFAMTTLWCCACIGIPQTWSAMGALWCTTVAIWAAVDRQVYSRLHSGRSIDVDEHTPDFASGVLGRRRGFWEWLMSWVGREVLALPIWSWAFYRPAVVTWRGKTYKVARDMSAVEYTRPSKR